MDLVRITVANWSKYNPRTDRASHSWFRLERSISTSQDLFGLKPSQKWVWVCIMCEACRVHGEEFDINLEWLAQMSGATLGEVRQTIEFLLSRGIVKAQAVTSGIPADTKCLTTNVRTNERTEHTNGSVHWFDAWLQEKGFLDTSLNTQRPKVESHWRTKESFDQWFADLQTSVAFKKAREITDPSKQQSALRRYVRAAILKEIGVA